MKKVFVVDANLEIHEVEVSESEWIIEYFIVEIEGLPRLVHVNGFTHTTEFAGFETEEKAREFINRVRDIRRQNEAIRRDQAFLDRPPAILPKPE